MKRYKFESNWNKKARQERFKNGLLDGLWPYIDLNICLLNICLFALFWDGATFEICLLGFWFWVRRK